MMRSFSLAPTVAGFLVAYSGRLLALQVNTYQLRQGAGVELFHDL